MIHKTRISVTVLSDGEVDSDMTLGDIARSLVDGELVGTWEIRDSKELTNEQARSELYKVGSDPSFFNLDDDEDEAPETDELEDDDGDVD